MPELSSIITAGFTYLHCFNHHVINQFIRSTSVVWQIPDSCITGGPKIDFCQFRCSVPLGLITHQNSAPALNFLQFTLAFRTGIISEEQWKQPPSQLKNIIKSDPMLVAWKLLYTHVIVRKDGFGKRKGKKFLFQFLMVGVVAHRSHVLHAEGPRLNLWSRQTKDGQVEASDTVYERAYLEICYQSQ